MLIVVWILVITAGCIYALLGYIFGWPTLLPMLDSNSSSSSSSFSSENLSAPPPTSGGSSSIQRMSTNASPNIFTRLMTAVSPAQVSPHASEDIVVTYRGTWNPESRYSKGDIVKDHDKLLMLETSSPQSKHDSVTWVHTPMYLSELFASYNSLQYISSHGEYGMSFQIHYPEYSLVGIKALVSDNTLLDKPVHVSFYTVNIDNGYKKLIFRNSDVTMVKIGGLTWIVYRNRDEKLGLKEGSKYAVSITVERTSLAYAPILIEKKNPCLTNAHSFGPTGNTGYYIVEPLLLKNGWRDIGNL